MIEAISKTGFRFKIKADPRFKPQAYIEYFEDLNRGSNTDIGLEDIFEMASKNFDRELGHHESSLLGRNPLIHIYEIM